MAGCIGYFMNNPDGTENENRLEVHAIAADDDLVFVVQDVTREGFEWIKGEMAMVDDGDKDMLVAVAADLRKRRPAKYSWTWRQLEDARIQRIANLPLRRCNGQYKSQGAW